MIINLIASGGGASVLTGDATTGDVLINKTFYSNDPASKLTGTMPDRSGDTACVSSSVDGTTLKLLASEGYRDGVNDNVTITDADFVAGNIKNGVNVFGLAGTYTGLDTSDATAAAGDLKYNKTAYVNGSKLTGTGADWQYIGDLYQAFYVNGAYTTKLPANYTIYAPNCLGLTQAFQGQDVLVNLSFTFGTINKAWSSFNQAFAYCSNLETLIGTFTLGSTVDTITNPFVSCAKLTTITFANSCIYASISFASCPLLNSASLISIANGLNASVAPKTLTMHATSKTNMNNLMVDNNSGVAVAGTAMTLTAFITDIKGWTVA